VLLHPFSNEEWEILPHVIWTSNADWDLSVLDLVLDDDDHWFDAITDLDKNLWANLFDLFGNYIKHVCVHDVILSSDLEPDLNFFDALEDAPSSNVSDIMDHCV
jgi:hypothetical protein